MLILMRRSSESIILRAVGKTMRVTVLDIVGGFRCRLVLEMPPEVIAVRGEMYRDDMKRTHRASPKKTGRLVLTRKRREVVYLLIPGVAEPVVISAHKIQSECVQVGLKGDQKEVRIARAEIDESTVRTVGTPGASAVQGCAYSFTGAS